MNKSIHADKAESLADLAVGASPGLWRICVGTGAFEIRVDLDTPRPDGTTQPRICRVLVQDENAHENAERIVHCVNNYAALRASHERLEQALKSYVKNDELMNGDEPGWETLSYENAIAALASIPKELA
jgi:hypothetical protein